MPTTNDGLTGRGTRNENLLDNGLPASYRKPCVRWTSITIGLLRISFAAVAMILESEAIRQGSYISGYNFIALWAGIPCMVAGVFGVASGLCVNRRLLITHSSLSGYFGLVFSGLHTGLGAVSVRFDGHGIQPHEVGWVFTSSGTDRVYEGNNADKSLMIGVTFLGCLQFVCNMIAVFIHYRAYRRKRTSRSRTLCITNERSLINVSDDLAVTAALHPFSVHSPSVGAALRVVGQQNLWPCSPIIAGLPRGPPAYEDIDLDVLPASDPRQDLPPSYETVMQQVSNMNGVRRPNMEQGPQQGSIPDMRRTHQEETGI